MNKEFDCDKFASMIKEKRTKLAITRRAYRTLGKDIGVSWATLYRAERKEVMPTAAAFLKICDWLNVKDTSIFLKQRS